MKKKQKTLLQSLKDAIYLYNPELNEEQGGFILKQAHKNNYEFVLIANELTGTPQARGLYVANTAEFNNKVALRIIDDKWSAYASYHTHPKGMRALPSVIDLGLLFTSFPINYIYAHGKELNRFEYNPDNGNIMPWDTIKILDFRKSK